MAIALSSVKDAADVLTVVESVEFNGKTLAVCDSSSGQVLARERERGLPGSDGKRSRDNGTEHYFKRTSALADIRDAIAGDLIA